MKKSAFMIAVLIVLSLMIACDSKEKNDRQDTNKETGETVVTAEDVDEAKEVLDKIKTERERTQEVSEKLKGMKAEEFGFKTLKAVQELDLDTVKSLVGTGMAVNMDMEFLKGEQEKYLQNWDGTIKGVKYRKAQLTGTPQAVICYMTDNGKIMAHILEKRGNQEGRWYAFGGRYGFEAITEEEYESYTDDFDTLTETQ